MNFVSVLIQCLANDELIAQFNRLTGRNLGQRHPRTAIDSMIDNATGYTALRDAEDQEDMRAFAQFVHDAILSRMESQRDYADALTSEGEG